MPSPSMIETWPGQVHACLHRHDHATQPVGQSARSTRSSLTPQRVRGAHPARTATAPTGAPDPSAAAGAPARTRGHDDRRRQHRPSARAGVEIRRTRAAPRPSRSQLGDGRRGTGHGARRSRASEPAASRRAPAPIVARSWTPRGIPTGARTGSRRSGTCSTRPRSTNSSPATSAVSRRSGRTSAGCARSSPRTPASPSPPARGPGSPTLRGSPTTCSSCGTAPLHMVSNHVIDVQEERATVHATLHATHVHRSDDPGAHLRIGGYVDADAVRTPRRLALPPPRDPAGVDRRRSRDAEDSNGVPVMMWCPSWMSAWWPC